MKKVTTILALTFAVVGSAVAQMVIPGETFSSNPARFNGRIVSIKNIQLDFSNKMPVAPGVIAPAGAPGVVSLGAPGPAGSPTAPATAPCRPPRGFKQLDVDFIGDPNYKGCFFMSDNMHAELQRQAGGQAIDAQITFRGDNRVGYNVTFYRIGR